MVILRGLRRGSGRGADVAVLVGWLLVFIGSVLVAAAAGTAPVHALAYFGTWVVSTTVPGTLVWRALAPHSSVVEDVGFGNVVGVALLLLSWVPAVQLGEARFAWWGPLTVIAVFAGVPALRRHWWPHRKRVARTPHRWHFTMAAVSLVAIARLLVVDLRALPVPGTADTRVHPDMWFQLALVNQLETTLSVERAQVAGTSMTYHWFANADIAATAAMSGVPATTVLFQLWLVVMTLTIVFAAAAVAWRLMDAPGSRSSGPTRSWYVGPLAALLVGAVPVALVLGEPRLRNLGNGVITVSPSGTLGLVVVLALCGPVVALLRGRGGAGAWALAVLLMALAAGVKPSILPVTVAGLLLAGTVHLLKTRTFPRTATFLVLGATALMGLASLPLMRGVQRSEIRAFETLKLDPATWVQRPDAGLVAVGVFALYLVSEIPRLLAVVGVAQRRTRSDPAIWWCSGVVLAGFCALWILDHPGFGQQYFWRVVIVLAVVTTIVIAVRAVPSEYRTWHSLVPLLVVVLAGVAVGSWVLRLPPVDIEDPLTGAFERLQPYAVAAAVLMVTLGALRLPPLRRYLPRIPVLTMLVAFCFAAGTPAAVADLTGPVARAASGQPPAYTERQDQRLVTQEGQQAALWLRGRVGEGDHVVTNVVCVPTRYLPGCEHTGFWVAALSDSEVVMGGWAYTAENLANYATSDGGRSYKRLPSPFPTRTALSLDLIRDPDAGTVRRLREDYDARWVFAAHRATPVSAELVEYAELVFRNSEVAIYELR